MPEQPDEAPNTDVPASWWRDGVLYQVYPRSFADSDGDGIGDLVGIRERLDHLQWLGVTGIWLNPTMPSPNDDWGYDVADYLAVHPDLGTMDDLDALIAAARERGIRVLLDLVPNHTSDRHPWFVDALSGRDAPDRDVYVWAPPAPDGGPPNNWISNFGGSAWTLHEPTGEYYLAQFLPTQPDLNWWNEEVRQRFDDILRFWFRRGVAGFRIDVCHAIVKDRELRDDPPVTPDDHRELRHRSVKPVYSANRPEVHDVLRRWRDVADACADDADGDTPILVGETYVLELDELLPFYGTGRDELHLAFNFLFVHADLDADQMREIVEGVEAGLPPDAWPVYTGSNHDAGRLTTRWAQDDERRARAALLILLTLRGTPFLYYGDEIALPNVPLDAETALDPVARRTGDPSDNRDVCRTPMPWTDAPGGGFTTAEATPWLPFGDLAAHNVAAQRDDPASTLHLVRDLIALRRGTTDLTAGAYVTLDAPAGAWAYRRGDGFAVAVNLSDAPVTVEGLDGAVAIATDRARDGEPVAGALELGPWEGAVVELG
ncbi:MAG: alpha-amylase family glycosyl hydrolase [Solirubrobacteraceae bacterium]|nr:alpha-amylase family glycosyl hydrolase [Solirubrobacteraceae bacterium]